MRLNLSCFFLFEENVNSISNTNFQNKSCFFTLFSHTTLFLKCHSSFFCPLRSYSCFSISTVLQRIFTEGTEQSTVPPTWSLRSNGGGQEHTR